MNEPEIEILVNFGLWGLFGLYAIGKLLGCVQIVPNRTVRIVERLGRFHRKLEPGFHLLVPWVDRVTYVHDLREQTIDVPAQQCFTLDNVRVIVDGVMYIQVVDPVKTSFGVSNYRMAAMQLALTTSRAIIATLELDKTFEERDLISAKVVEEVARAGETWGIQVLRYEIKTIEPPDTVKAAMEMQVTAERNRRAIIAKSEGDMQARINRSEGLRNELVARSAGERQKLINEAQGRAKEIESLAEATAASIEKLADAVSVEGGEQAVRLRLSEAYLDKLKGLADPGTQILLPADLTRVDSILAALEIESDVALGMGAKKSATAPASPPRFSPGGSPPTP
jgi:regulator of protease activity HflC (stomatin/prohibitin superfamily)